MQLGTGTTCSIAEVVERCMVVTGQQAEIVTEHERVRPDASEVQVLLSDPERPAPGSGGRP